jgi:hypothetical protein
VIIGGGVILHVVYRVLGWPQARRWSDAGNALFMVGVPWQVRALFFALIGGGSAYHLATGAYHWYWWLVPAVAFAVLGEVVVTRK